MHPDLMLAPPKTTEIYRRASALILPIITSWIEKLNIKNIATFGRDSLLLFCKLAGNSLLLSGS